MIYQYCLCLKKNIWFYSDKSYYKRPYNDAFNNSGDSPSSKFQRVDYSQPPNQGTNNYQRGNFGGGGYNQGRGYRGNNSFGGYNQRGRGYGRGTHN